MDHRISAIKLLESVFEQKVFYVKYEMPKNLIEFYEEQKLISKLFNLRVQLGYYKEAFDLASSMSCYDESVINKNQLSKITSLVWVDRIFSDLSSSLIAIIENEENRS